MTRVDGETLYCRDVGPRTQPVVLLHGIPETGDAIASAMAGLGRRDRLIVPDMRGAGASHGGASDSLRQASGDDKKTPADDINGRKKQLTRPQRRRNKQPSKLVLSARRLPALMDTTPCTAAHATSTHYLFFGGLFESVRSLSFPCDVQGRVEIDCLSERARNNYFFAHTVVGRDYTVPVIVPALKAD